MNLYQTLKHYFGYDTLRPGQQDLMEGILNGSDVLGIMPTGAGKSLCYQVPALMLPGITIVISPLISLMSDQVKAGRRTCGIYQQLTDGKSDPGGAFVCGTGTVQDHLRRAGAVKYHAFFRFCMPGRHFDGDSG